MNGGLWTSRDARITGAVKTTFRNAGGDRNLSGLRNGPEKRTTPARGEEAEVVVYQPRGVGLMHTRNKPSNAHYTHASRPVRKSDTSAKAPVTTKVGPSRHLS